LGEGRKKFGVWAPWKREGGRLRNLGESWRKNYLLKREYQGLEPGHERPIRKGKA